MGDEHTQETPTTTTAQPAPEYAPWTSQIPKDLLDESFSGIKTLGDYIKTQKQLKADHEKVSARMKEAVFAPGKDASEAEKAAYRKALGVPEKAESYKIDGKDVSKERIAEIRDFAFRNNLTQAQASALFEREEQDKKAFLESYNAKRAERKKAAENFLSNEYGEKKKEKVEHAFRLIEKIGGEDLKKELNETGLGDSVNLIKFVVKISESFNEDGMAIGEGTRNDEEFNPSSLYPKSNHKSRGK